MTPADAVFEDALREAGYQRLTPWHLRCVEAYLVQLATRDIRAAHYTNARTQDLHERLGYDLNNTLDELHLKAQWDDAQWMAQTHAQRAVDARARREARGETP